MLGQSILWGAIGGGISAFSTLLGASLVLYKSSPRQPESKTLSHIFTFEFIIGMMLAASAYSLIFPAYQQIPDTQKNWLILPLVFGVLFILTASRLIEKYQPHTKAQMQNHARATLFIVAMMLHNLPEGLASGSALSPQTQQHLWSPVIAIALQNFPEGFLTAIAFYTLGLGKWKAFWGAGLTAAVELFGGVLGGASTAFWSIALPFLLAFAGSAMMFVSLRELVMETKSHSLSFGRLAVGFILFSVLGIALQ